MCQPLVEFLIFNSAVGRQSWLISTPSHQHQCFLDALAASSWMYRIASASRKHQCFFFPWQILVPVAILKKVPVAGQKCAWQYSKIAQNARARTKLGKIARGKFEKSARAPTKNARGKLWTEVCHGHDKVPREKKNTDGWRFFATWKNTDFSIWKQKC